MTAPASESRTTARTQTCTACSAAVPLGASECPHCQAPTPAGIQLRARGGWVSLLCIGCLIVGFALGRSGTGLRSDIMQAKVATAENRDLAATKSMPEPLKYDLFLRGIAEDLPSLQLHLWRLDANGNLVLYLTSEQKWAALPEAEQRKLMQLLGVTYTAYRLQTGMPVAMNEGRHPVLTLAADDGRVLASRGESGGIEIYRH